MFVIQLMNHNKTDSSADNAEDCIWEGFLFYFILILFNFIFFSIKKQMPDSCLGSLTTAITVLVTGYHIRAL